MLRNFFLSMVLFLIMCFPAWSIGVGDECSVSFDNYFEPPFPPCPNAPPLSYYSCYGIGDGLSCCHDEWRILQGYTQQGVPIEYCWPIRHVYQVDFSPPAPPDCHDPSCCLSPYYWTGSSCICPPCSGNYVPDASHGCQCVCPFKTNADCGNCKSLNLVSCSCSSVSFRLESQEQDDCSNGLVVIYYGVISNVSYIPVVPFSPYSGSYHLYQWNIVDGDWNIDLGSFTGSLPLSMFARSRSVSDAESEFFIDYLAVLENLQVDVNCISFGYPIWDSISKTFAVQLTPIECGGSGRTYEKGVRKTGQHIRMRGGYEKRY